MKRQAGDAKISLTKSAVPWTLVQGTTVEAVSCTEKNMRLCALRHVFERLTAAGRRPCTLSVGGSHVRAPTDRAPRARPSALLFSTAQRSAH